MLCRRRCHCCLVLVGRIGLCAESFVVSASVSAAALVACFDGRQCRRASVSAVVVARVSVSPRLSVLLVSACVSGGIGCLCWLASAAALVAWVLGLVCGLVAGLEPQLLLD